MATVLEQFLTQIVTNSFTFIQSILVDSQPTELPVSLNRLADSQQLNPVNSSHFSIFLKRHPRFTAGSLAWHSRYSSSITPLAGFLAWHLLKLPNSSPSPVGGNTAPWSLIQGGWSYSSDSFPSTPNHKWFSSWQNCHFWLDYKPQSQPYAALLLLDRLSDSLAARCAWDRPKLQPSSPTHIHPDSSPGGTEPDHLTSFK
ncbi:hypothetical protein AB205_0098540 [Aquarana catesbeiana]|uniref:Uncharacterized protein n=2 Tax=Aquarana catesbeiana TaxID=8400 RepID=A0A2G9S3C8_AQUCT|nr:hypothetical protein AB205_0098540 [Aquarana catesbeiana]